MRRGRTRQLLLAALWCTSLMGADCEDDSPIPPARDFGVVLHDPGYGHKYRSQPGPTYNWDGRGLAYVEMTAPITATGTVQAEDGAEALLGVCVFLEGAGELGDLSGIVDSNGLFTRTIVPSTYDLVIAPDCFTGTRPAQYIEQVVLDGTDTEPWLLPERQSIAGQVVDAAQDPIVGAVVTLYEAERPDRPIGVTVVSDSLGNFSFDVPEGEYDVVVTTPADGSIPIGPIRLGNRTLPLPGPQGLIMKIQYPVLSTAHVAGSLTEFGGAATTGRVRVEGWVPPESLGSSKLPLSPQFTGGAFRAEFETNADGSWGIELPRGSYRATAFPRHSPRSLGIATSEFEVVVDSPLVGVDLVFPNLNTPAEVKVRQNNGNPMVGAELAIRMTSPPYYSYVESTNTEGDWFGRLIPDFYEIEVIPPDQPDSGEQRFARAHGTLDLLSPDQRSVTIQMRRSDLVDGFLYTIDQEEVGNVHVILTDPESGEIWDETVTNLSNSEFPGFFRATLPR